MSTVEVADRTSLKRKLEDSDLDFPNPKRQRLNENTNVNTNETKDESKNENDYDQNEHHDDKTIQSDANNNTLTINKHTTSSTLSSLTHLTDIQSTILLNLLSQLRTELKNKHNIPHLHDIFTEIQMSQLSKYAPISLDNLSHFDGFDEIKVNKYGNDIVSVISEYILSPTHSNQETNEETNEETTILALPPTHSNGELILSLNSDKKEEEIAPKIQKKKKRFVDSDSESDDNDNDNAINAINAISSKTKFVYGHTVETIGKEINDEEEDDDDEEEEEDNDLDLDGFIVDDEDDDEDEEEEEDEDIDHRMITRILTRNHTFTQRDLEEEEEEEEEEGDDDDDDDDDDDVYEDYVNNNNNDDNISDGESININSIDEEIEKEIYGVDDTSLADLTFMNAIKRKSLIDMIKIFEQGINIKNTCFFTHFGGFMKGFNDKSTKALRLLSFLLPLGFADNKHKHKYKHNDMGMGLYDPVLFKLIKKKHDNDIPVDKELHPQEYEFLQCINNEEWHRIPAILAEGVSVNVIPKFFMLMEEFRMIIIKKWFEAITYQNMELICQYHNIFGINIDLQIPRKMVQEILETEDEHLAGATGLIIASLVGALQIVEYFVDNGADIEYKLKFGHDTALIYATRRGNISVVKYLLNVGANINAITMQSEAYADTACPVAFEAVIHGKKDILQYLTYYGADLYLIGPTTMSGTVSVMRSCLMEENQDITDAIKNGLNKRFDLIKQCLSTQFPKDIDIMNNIAVVICDEFLNPMQKDFLDSGCII